MHNDSNTVPFRASHQDEFITMDDVTEIPMTSPSVVRWWRHIGTGPTFFDLKSAREQTRTGFAA